MGLVTVTKCLFYLEAKSENFQLKTDGPADPMRHRTGLDMRTTRLPWGSGTGKTVGFFHDAEVNVGNRVQGTNAAAIGDYLLGVASGRPVWQHPKLIVADVTDKRVLMSGPEMGRILLARAQQAGKVARGIKPYALKARRREVWIPYDPTRPGKVYPKESLTRQQANQIFDRPIGNVYKKATRKGRDTDYNHDVVTIVGAAYLLTYHTTPPADVIWPSRIRDRFQKNLSASDVPNVGKWYGIGAFSIEQDASARLVSRYRASGGQFKTYRPGVGLTPIDPDKDELVLRRIVSVDARDHADAQRKIQAYLDNLKIGVNRDQAYLKELAWSRTSHRVIGSAAWDTSMRNRRSPKSRSFLSTRPRLPIHEEKRRLREKFYRRLSRNRVY